MIDLALEIVSALILLGIVLFLWWTGWQRVDAARKGWNFIVTGFGLLLFGSLIDITDNFESLNGFAIIGDTGMQAFLEKFVGFLGGFIVLAWGLVLWIPLTQRPSSEIDQRRRAEEALHHEQEMLETRVREQTSEIESANTDLQRKIAKREQAVAEIEKGHALLHGIVTTVGDGIITFDDQGVIASFNPGAEKIFGYSAGDVTGQNIKMLMPSEFARGHDRHVSRFRSTGTSSAIGARLDLLGLRKDGVSFPMDLTINEMLVDGQRMFIGIIRDITVQREREAALRAKTAVLALMQSIAASANEVTDTDAFILSCVDNICRYSGWPVGHAYRTRNDGENVLHPTNIWHLVDPVRFDNFRRITDQTSFRAGVGLPGRVMASGRPEWIVDITKSADFPRAEGGVEIGIKAAFAFPVKVRNKCVLVLEFFSPVTTAPDGELLGVIANVSEQVSRRMEREEADKALRATKTEAERSGKRAQSAAEEAKAASQAKLDFLATMSHELRTPLNGILGLAALIEQETLGPLGNEQYANYVRIIGSNGRHLVNVIHDVLDYSKIEAGMLELDPVAFNPVEMTASAVEILTASAQKKAIELTLDVAPDVPANLIGDQERLRQILLNLTGNAIKFTDEGGVKVEVSLKASTLDDALLRFEVSDSGIGISKKAQEKLFEKFTQADVSTTRKYGGTGLGLAISKQIVGLMDGEIGVDSQPGKGSTFWFNVKLARQATEARGDCNISEQTLANAPS